MVVACLAIAVSTSAEAQGRGGRQGGPPGVLIPTGPLCHNRGDAAIKSTTNTVNVNGVEMVVSEAVLTGKPGVKELLYPCPAGFGGADPLAKYFFPPELIMSHQQAINLSDGQRTAIRSMMLEAQQRFVPAQFRVASEIEKLQALIDTSPVDENAVLAEIDRVLAVEREIKREQISLMVRIKNTLTPQQREVLAKLRPG